METKNTSPLSIFLIFLRLGATCFGGPIAHLGYFREEFVRRRQWLDDHAYGDLVSLSQFLPGPASSQVGIGLGLFRGGLTGAIAAWLGFTLPSAIALVLFGLVLAHSGNATGGAWLHGLKVAAVAVVAQALWGMGKNLCPDKERATLAVLAAAAVAAEPSAWTQIMAIAVSALVGWRWLSPAEALPHSPFPVRLSKRAGIIALALFAAILTLLPIYASRSGIYHIQLFDSFFRAGALVFGGGHVVLPVLQAEVVPRGWVSRDAFLAGYGAAQAVPGPLFTFAAYLGAVSTGSANPWLNATIATIAIFLPGFLLMIGALPLWEALRAHPAMQRAMQGVNASVVGLLLAAFYQPVWTSAIHAPGDFTLAVAAFLLLVFWKLPSWLVVMLCAAASSLGLL
ncbi:chromate transporter [Paludibacterium purpuratum]|uniref:Chromate transporter n=1 Tax=Paludibacterium purpuratum TaxID=1144873 RepID=A0A4V3DUY9_9NEIS|nr:chromate transporter [Paludibacterium purpuratum]TDR77827.1 chromate transporter [Paludibacterium purpuratum]